MPQKSSSTRGFRDTNRSPFWRLGADRDRPHLHARLAARPPPLKTQETPCPTTPKSRLTPPSPPRCASDPWVTVPRASSRLLGGTKSRTAASSIGRRARTTSRAFLVSRAPLDLTMPRQPVLSTRRSSPRRRLRSPPAFPRRLSPRPPRRVARRVSRSRAPPTLPASPASAPACSSPTATSASSRPPWRA